MTMNKQAASFIKLLKADESGELQFRSFWARGMYGSECLAIEGKLGDIFSNLMALALEGAECLTEDDKHNIIMGLSRGVQTDSMGLGDIVYFPGIKFSRQDSNDAMGYDDEEDSGEHDTDGLTDEE